MAGADNLNLDLPSLLTFARQVVPEKEKGKKILSVWAMTPTFMLS